MGLLFIDLNPPYKGETRRSKVQKADVMAATGGEKESDEDL